MGWLFGSIVLILLFIVILLFSQIYFTIDFIINDKEHQFIVTVYLFRILIMKKVNPTMPDATKDMLEKYDIEPSLDRIFEDIKEILQRLKQFHQLSLDILHRLTFHRLDWKTNFGTGEASSTGLVIGGLWGIKGILMSYLSEHSRLKCHPHTNVLPHFQQKLMSSTFNCIVSIRIGQAIYAFIKAIWTFQKSS